MTTGREFTLGNLNEAIADAYPEREAIVTPTRRFRWRDFQLRTRRLANLLLEAGLGCHRERSELEPWESGQDHLGLYLYNCPEYLEGMVGASKARVASFNVNYRYVEDELLYLFRDAKPKALLYHASFAPQVARLRSELPELRLLLQVDDGSGEPLLPGALDYEEALARSSDTLPPVEPRGDDLYILYTGGTTGMPKGVLWRQEDIFFAAMGGRVVGGEPVRSIEEVVERAKGGETLRMLPAPPFMHGAAHWSAFIMLHSGGTVVLPKEVRKLDPDDIWRTVEREKVLTLTIVGDAFARPLLDALRKGSYDVSSLRILGSGGAILSPELKKEFLELLPDIVIFDGFGASETGAQGAAVSMKGMEKPPEVFQMDEQTVVLDENLTRKLEPGEDAIGWLARTGYVPLGYLGDPEKTRKTYPVIDGVRYAVPGDRAKLAPDGKIYVLGRDSVCINTGGEKVFAEEVELALKSHPAVYDAVVVGTPHERWGQQVTAVVALRPGTSASEEELRAEAAKKLARYKLPRAFVFVDSVVRAPTGKPDYRWARETALRALSR
ncbi:MAG: acyl-CoA synthetase [Candidatus Binatia bacterium]|nr:MAG: acyl-CoA synthetase [Candidatus Binatia bacterium]